MRIFESKNLAGDCTIKSVCGRKGYLIFCIENTKQQKGQKKMRILISALGSMCHDDTDKII